MGRGNRGQLRFGSYYSRQPDRTGGQLCDWKWKETNCSKHHPTDSEGMKRKEKWSTVFYSRKTSLKRWRWKDLGQQGSHFQKYSSFTKWGDTWTSWWPFHSFIHPTTTLIAWFRYKSPTIMSNHLKCTFQWVFIMFTFVLISPQPSFLIVLLSQKGIQYPLVVTPISHSSLLSSLLITQSY